MIDLYITICLGASCRLLSALVGSCALIGFIPGDSLPKQKNTRVGVHPLELSENYGNSEKWHSHYLEIGCALEMP